MSIFSIETLDFEHLDKELTFLTQADLGKSPFFIIDGLKKNNIFYDFLLFKWGIFCSRSPDLTSVNFVILVEIDVPFGGAELPYLEFIIPIMGGVIHDDSNDHPSPLDHENFRLKYNTYYEFLVKKFGEPKYHDYNYTEIYSKNYYMSVWEIDKFDIVLAVKNVHSVTGYELNVHVVYSDHRKNINPNFEKYSHEDYNTEDPFIEDPSLE